jgi:DNA-binding MarR family transcriptional regulator
MVKLAHADAPVRAPIGDDELRIAALDRVYMLLQRTRLWTIPVLQSFELTEATSQVLWALHPTTSAPTMRELAGWLAIDPSSATFLIDRLEARGYVERQVDPKDRRGKRVLLTAEGLDLRTRMIAALGVCNPMNGLTVREMRQLLRLLDKASPPSPNQTDLLP